MAMPQGCSVPCEDTSLLHWLSRGPARALHPDTRCLVTVCFVDLDFTAHSGVVTNILCMEETCYLRWQSRVLGPLYDTVTCPRPGPPRGLTHRAPFPRRRFPDLLWLPLSRVCQGTCSEPLHSQGACPPFWDKHWPCTPSWPLAHCRSLPRAHNHPRAFNLLCSVLKTQAHSRCSTNAWGKAEAAVSEAHGEGWTHTGGTSTGAHGCPTHQWAVTWGSPRTMVLPPPQL